MRIVILIAALLAGLAPAATEYLVRIDLDAPGEQLPVLADRGVRVLADLDRACLARLDESEFERVGADFRWSILDDQPAEKSYMFVSTRRGVEPGTLKLPGTLLLSEGRSALLRIAEDDIPELHRLPVELARLSMVPMVITRDADRPPLEARPIADSLVARIVGSVAQDSVLGWIRRLVGFHTRYSTHDSCRAAVEWMKGRLLDYGCDSVYSQPFANQYAPNAVGVKWGTVNPRRIYIIGGHIDDRSELEPYGYAPGADDNASGTTAVLEAARVFADYEFEYTVIFIGFSAEEQGLIGSDSFATRAWRRRDTILGVLNFDMISYGRPGYDTIGITTKTRTPDCRPLMNLYIANADTYTTLNYKPALLSSGGRWTDHWPFWNRGYLAISGEEDDFTPEYHTTGDTIGPFGYRNCGTNNIPLCTEAIKAAVATLAKLAGAHQLSGVGSLRNADCGLRNAGAFPNPFREQVTFRLPAAVRELRVFDASGRQVRALPVATGSTVWDGQDATARPVVPGVYFYHAGTSSGRLVKAGE